MKRRRYLKVALLSLLCMGGVVVSEELLVGTSGIWGGQAVYGASKGYAGLSKGLVQELEAGGSYLLNETYYKLYYETREYIGRQDGQFIVPRGQMDRLIQSADGDVEKLEKALGVNGLKGETVYRVDLWHPLEHNPRLPSGKASGANEHFIERGKTVGGQDEVIVDQFARGESEAYIVLMNQK